LKFNMNGIWKLKWSIVSESLLMFDSADDFES
jgi:hypothetical protein